MNNGNPIDQAGQAKAQRLQLLRYCYWLAVCASVMCFISFGRSKAIDLPTMHLDGAFQTTSGDAKPLKWKYADPTRRITADFSDSVD